MPIKYRFVWIVFAGILSACSVKESKQPLNTKQAALESRTTDFTAWENSKIGKSYLPVYSQIYQLHEHRTYNLTVTVSLRNVSPTDTVYISKADYHDTSGQLIKAYISKPIYLKPLETVEIVISENDEQGGTGGNFIFEWAVKNELYIPLFEAIMISTTGQQGLSFTTRAVQISK